ncbi:MAG: 6-phosphofructokinase, partial [Acidimicrobiales bacterium]
LDPETGRTKVRLVDVDSTRYSIARRYMIRLRRDDFGRPEALASFAEVAGISVPEFVEEFEPIVAEERPPLII